MKTSIYFQKIEGCDISTAAGHAGDLCAVALWFIYLLVIPFNVPAIEMTDNNNFMLKPFVHGAGLPCM